MSLISLANIFAKLLVAYAVIVAALYFLQRHILYQPDSALDMPGHYGMTHTDVLELEASDGVRITVWHRPAKKDYPTIIYFHGNGATLGNRGVRLEHFADAGYGILALSYRGYGSSEGAPSEAGLYADAEAVIEHARQQLGLKPNQIILYGESLGTGVAVEMATRHSVGMVVLEAPYTSVVNRAAEIYFWLPVRWLIKDRFESINKIERVRVPLLILHGERDSIIPVHHGRALLEAANEPKHGLFYPEVNHGSFPLAGITRAITEMASEHGLVEAAKITE